MKVFIRNLKLSANSKSISLPVDLLDLTKYAYSEINKVDISIDNTSSSSSSSSSILNNIKSEQRVDIGGYRFAIRAGYYTLTDLMSVINKYGMFISLITTEENAYHCKAHSYIEFGDSIELQEILGFDSSSVKEGAVSEHPCDITRGMNVIHFYSSIVNSDNDTPFATIKIDDPTVDFHQTINTKIALSKNAINYIDISLRDIHGEYITLNGDISITLFINCKEEFEQVVQRTTRLNNVQAEQPVQADLHRFNKTSIVPSLKNGRYSERINHPITNGCILNANFLVRGKIKNLSSDQRLNINGAEFSVPAGCYSLEMLLAYLNSLTAAVFSYIKSGENAFHVQISNVSSIDFKSSELANMLGFNIGIIKVDDVVFDDVQYQLTSEHADFVISAGNVTKTLSVPTGMYTEDGFFNNLLSTIKQEVNCSLEKTDKYFLFKGIDSISGNISGYYWSSFLNRRKSTDGNIIPRVGCFYYNKEVTVRSTQEIVEVANGNHGGMKSIKVYYSDGTYKAGHVIPGILSVSEFARQTAEKFFLSTYFHIDYYKNVVHFRSKQGVNAYFVMDGIYLDVFHLPREPSTDFYMYVSNDMYKSTHPDIIGRTIIFYHQENNDHAITYNITENKNLYIQMRGVRDVVNAYLNEYFGTTSQNAFLVYNNPMNVTIRGDSSTLLYANKHHFKFGGTAIEEGLIHGFPTEYVVGTYSFDLWNVFSDCTHTVDLGYTDMVGVGKGIQEMLERDEYFSTVNPHCTVSYDGDKIVVDNPEGFVSIEQDELPSEQEIDPVITFQPVRTNIHCYNVMYKITTNNNTFIINGKSYSLPTGFYTYSKIISTLNNLLVGYVFIMTSTYYELVHQGATINGSLLDVVPFTLLSGSIRLYYPDHMIIDNFHINSVWPMNITNGFNLVNVFSNLVETDDNYLSSFVIDTTDGINVSNAGCRSNYSNSNRSINRYIGNTNSGTLDYYFTREDGSPFSIDGQIIVGLEIQQE